MTSPHWWHKDRTGDKEQVAKKGNVNAVDTPASEVSAFIGESTNVEPAQEDGGGATPESIAGAQAEGQQGDEADQT